MTKDFKFIFPSYASGVEIEIKRDHDEAVTELTIHIHTLASAVPFPEKRDVTLAKTLSNQETK